MTKNLSKKRRRREKRARNKIRQIDALAAAVEQVATQLPQERPDGEDHFLVELIKINDPADLWNEAATAIGTWAQVRRALPLALLELLPIRAAERIRIRVFQGRQSIAARMQETLTKEAQYQKERRGIGRN